MKIFLITLLVLVLVYYLFVQKPKPLKHRDLSPARLLKLVQALYFRGFDGAELALYAKGLPSPVFRVTKQIVQDNDVRLIGAISFVPGSPERERFLGSLLSLGASYEERSTNDSSVACTVTVPFGNDVAEVCRVARARFEAMGREIEHDGYLCLHDVIGRNVRIGWTS
jgi:hypothetical protein